MIQAVDRALRILTVLQGGRRMSLGEIAAAIDLAPSTVHGLVRTLLAHGMVQQETDSGQLPARTGDAAARQRVPRHARIALAGCDLGRGSRPPNRLRCAHRGAAVRRGRRRRARTPPRRHAADARGRHRRSRRMPARSARRCWLSIRLRRRPILRGHAPGKPSPTPQCWPTARADPLDRHRRRRSRRPCSANARPPQLVFDASGEATGRSALWCPRRAGRCHPRPSTPCATPPAPCHANSALLAPRSDAVP